MKNLKSEILLFILVFAATWITAAICASHYTMLAAGEVVLIVALIAYGRTVTVQNKKRNSKI